MTKLFGPSSKKIRISNEEPLEGKCPNCSGSLYPTNYSKWMNILFIPVYSMKIIDSFYECDKCKGTYSKYIRTVLDTPKEEQEKVIGEGKKLFAEALIASMTHMAVIDGEMANSEEREIYDAINQYGQYKETLLKIMEKVKTDHNNDNYVFNLLIKVKEVFSSEAVLNLIAQSAIVLLADGKIETNEKKLMEEYLKATGLSTNLFSILIEKLREIEVDID